MSFGLEKLSVVDKTARFELPCLDGAVLIVKPATEANKPYFNQVLKNSQVNSRSRRRNALGQKELDQLREMDCRLYPEHVIVGWEGLANGDGEAVVFSVEACKDFINELCEHAPWIFDELMLFTKNPENFVDLMDVEERTKN